MSERAAVVKPSLRPPPRIPAAAPIDTVPRRRGKAPRRLHAAAAAGWMQPPGAEAEAPRRLHAAAAAGWMQPDLPDPVWAGAARTSRGAMNPA